MGIEVDFVLRQTSNELRKLFGASSCSVQRFDKVLGFFGSEAGITVSEPGGLGYWDSPEYNRIQPLSEVEPLRKEIEEMISGKAVIFNFSYNDPRREGFEGFFKEASVCGIPILAEDSLIALALVRVCDPNYSFDNQKIESACRMGSIAAIGMYGVMLSEEFGKEVIARERRRISIQLYNTVAQTTFEIAQLAKRTRVHKASSGMELLNLKTLEELAKKCDHQIHGLMNDLNGVFVVDNDEDELGLSLNSVSPVPEWSITAFKQSRDENEELLEVSSLTSLINQSPTSPKSGRASSATPFNVNSYSYDSTILTRREVEVIFLLSKGLTNQEIGKKLFISINTVKKHVKKIFEKLNVKNRTAAVQKARDMLII